MRPTSVDLSKKGKSHSSYRSKSTVPPSGWHSSVKVDVGQIVRLRMGRLTRDSDSDSSALNCLVDLSKLIWFSDLRSEELDPIVEADWKDFPRKNICWVACRLASFWKLEPVGKPEPQSWYCEGESSFSLPWLF